MTTFMDQIRTKARSITSRKGVSGLQGLKILDGIKSTRSMVQAEGFIGVGQRAMKGERPVMTKLFPDMSLPNYRKSSAGPTSPPRRREPNSIVA